jgi:hypothetical protein
MALQDDLKKAEADLKEAQTVRDNLLQQLRAPNITAAQRNTIKAQLVTAEQAVKKADKAAKALREKVKDVEKQAEEAITSGEMAQSKFDLGVQTRTKTKDDAERSYLKDPTNDAKFATYQKAMQDLFNYEQGGVAKGLTVNPTVQQIPGGFGPVTPQTAPAVEVSKTNIPGPNVRVGVGRTATPKVTTTQTGAVTTTTETEPTTTTPTTTTGAITGAAPPTTTKKKKKAVAGTGPMGLTDAVRTELRTLFPQFAASFDGGEGEQQFVDFFGSDVVSIVVKAATEDAYGQLETEAEVGAFRADVERTSYGQRTSEAEQAFDFSPAKQAELIRVKKNEITKQYADLQLDTAQLDAVARDAARKNWSGDDLKFGVYNYAYGAKPTTAMQSEIADRIRNAGRAYGYVVSDAELKAALTNTPYNGMMVTEDSILQKAQRTAKGQYGHLADQIDAGVSLEDIFYNYKAYAARTLGVDPSEIDWVNDPKWAEAFGSKDQGQLSLNDWLFKIKSDKRYGYQFTPQAEQEVSSIVSTLEKAFGFRK